LEFSQITNQAAQTAISMRWAANAIKIATTTMARSYPKLSPVWPISAHAERG